VDDADRADLLAEREMAHLMALRAARDAMAPLESADLCAVCGDQISSARQIAVPGCQMCTYCAEDQERRAAMYRTGA
jgi:RNA polymerase-binding transcription factor DksA